MTPKREVGGKDKNSRGSWGGGQEAAGTSCGRIKLSRERERKEDGQRDWKGRRMVRRECN